MTDERRRLLREEEEAWEVFHPLTEQVPIDQLDDPSLPEGWTVKDLMFHVGAWQAEAGIQFERMNARTYVPSDESSDRQNAEWLQISRGLDAEACRAQLESGRTHMLHRFAELAEVGRDAIEWFAESGAQHYRAHLPDLRAWLAERRL